MQIIECHLQKDIEYLKLNNLISLSTKNIFYYPYFLSLNFSDRCIQ